MNATDRLALASLQEYHVKRAWIGKGISDTWDQVKDPVITGAEMLPGVGSVISGAKAVGSAIRGDWMGAAGNAAMAGVSLLPGGGVAGKGFMKFAPKTIGAMQIARNKMFDKTMGKAVGQVARTNEGKLKWGLGGGAMAANMLSPAQQATEAGTSMPTTELTSLMRTQIGNPMYAEPASNPILGGLGSLVNQQ